MSRVRQSGGVRAEETTIPGCLRVFPPLFLDDRGVFTKVFSSDVEAATGTTFAVREIFWSSSPLGVVRGLHFQLPPRTVRKIVWVTEGEIRDVVLDLRVDSPTFRQHEVFLLDPNAGSLLIPQGCAHGFEVVSVAATVGYAQDGSFDPACDAGIRWDTAGITWLTADPVVSTRDSELCAMTDFDAPFRLPEVLR
ncbi:MAG: dTDP-4-dehydrorhamnose 3,5-epimerase family protein [Actinomycetes bacterium]